MAQFTRIEVAVKMAEAGLVPVFYHKDVNVCKEVVTACYEGGSRVFEFTNRGDYAHEVFSELSKWVTIECPHLILGIGSVPDPGTAALFIQLGTNFVVSPYLNAETAKICIRRKILWLAGCGSPSEISYAEELGAEIVKIFPGISTGGPEFIKAIKAPCPWTSIIPTGGVEPTEENLRPWFKAGAIAVSMGSNLITNQIISNHDWKGLSKNVRATLELIKILKR